MTIDKATAWKQKLAQSRMALRLLLTSLKPEDWQTSIYGEGKSWTVSTVVSHLIEAERGMSIHVHKIRKGEETIPEGFDLDRWNAGVQKRMGALTPDELLSGLAEMRAKTLEVMDTIRDEEWALTGRHASRGIITIEQYYETMYGHELMHTQDIKEALRL
jgi:hypothetical protein